MMSNSPDPDAPEAEITKDDDILAEPLETAAPDDIDDSDPLPPGLHIPPTQEDRETDRPGVTIAPASATEL